MDSVLTAVENEDVNTFRTYVEDLTNAVPIDLYHAVVKTQNAVLLDLLFTRDLCISQGEYEKLSDGTIRGMVRQYRRDWTLYYMAASGIPIDEDDYPEVDFDRVIDGKTIREQVPMDESDVDTYSDDMMELESMLENVRDESKIQENGRLRIYQRRKGSLYCGLYAIQHVLNNTEDIDQDDLDDLSEHVVDGLELAPDEQESITSADHVDVNGNYSVDTLRTALEDRGYVTETWHRSAPSLATLQDEHTIGIIANRMRSHWIAFRRVGERWEECDSLSEGDFPLRTAEQVSARTVEAHIAVIRPPDLPEQVSWVTDEYKRQRLAQLFGKIKRNQ